jgi:O-succinylbenzoate synthase
MLGGTRAEIASGVSLGIEPTTLALFERIDKFVDEGYRRIKLKIGPGNDIEVLRRVRQRYPDLPLQVDANSAYTLADLDLLRQLDAFNLLLIEQPLAHDDIIDHAQLQAVLKTRVCLDESIHSADDARKALDLGACRVINIKVSRLGGLLEARKVHDHCFARGVPVWCGGMHEFGIGRAANLAIASLPGFTLPGDISGSDKYYRQDVVNHPILAHQGAIAVPNGPGLGVEPDEERINACALRRVTINA